MLFEQFSQSWTLSGAPHEFEEVIRNLHAHDSCPKWVGAYRGTDMCKLKLQTEKAMPSGIGAASAASSSVGEEGRARTQSEKGTPRKIRKSRHQPSTNIVSQSCFRPWLLCARGARGLLSVLCRMTSSRKQCQANCSRRQTLEHQRTPCRQCHQLDPWAQHPLKLLRQRAATETMQKIKEKNEIKEEW